MAERQRRTAVSIIEEIRRRLVEVQGHLEVMERSRHDRMVEIATLKAKIYEAAGSGDAE